MRLSSFLSPDRVTVVRGEAALRPSRRTIGATSCRKTAHSAASPLLIGATFGAFSRRTWLFRASGRSVILPKRCPSERGLKGGNEWVARKQEPLADCGRPRLRTSSRDLCAVNDRCSCAKRPHRPVRVTPGGPNNVFARLVAEQLAHSLDQQFYVEYQPDAGGNIGMGHPVQSAPRPRSVPR
jgi:hypothetical protein